MKFEELFKQVAIKVWGFNPNREIKVVHFANGFYNSICGKNGNIQMLQAAAASYLRGRAVDNEAFLVTLEEKEIYITENDEGNEVENLGGLRAALDLALSQDGALFPSGPSSVTLTHFLQTSSDPSDNKTGRFIVQVLADDEDSGVIEILRSKLNDKNDNLFLLTSPLLNDTDLGPAPTTEDWVKMIISESPHLRKIQNAFNRLIKYSDKLEKTVLLQRVVTLGSFALFLQLTNRKFEDGEDMARGFSPILLSSPEPSMEIREASRASFARGKQQIERGLAGGLRKELNNRGELNLSIDEYKSMVRSMLPQLNADSTGKNSDNTYWKRFNEEFDGLLLGAITNDEITDAFIKACVRTYYSKKPNPERVSSFIGKNIGLVYPRLQDRKQKYYLAAPKFLDTLVAAILGPDEEITLEEFWEFAWENFGIIVGMHGTKDMERLAKWGIRQVSTKQLANNAEKINAELVKMGYAKQYADDIAMIRGGGIPNE